MSKLDFRKDPARTPRNTVIYYALSYLNNFFGVDDFRPTGSYQVEKLSPSTWVLNHVTYGLSDEPGVLAYDRDKDVVRRIGNQAFTSLRAAKFAAECDYTAKIADARKVRA